MASCKIIPFPGWKDAGTDRMQTLWLIVLLNDGKGKNNFSVKGQAKGKDIENYFPIALLSFICNLFTNVLKAMITQNKSK